MNSMRIDDVKKLFGRILTKIYAFDFGDIEYDPETDTLSFNMISNLIKLFNRRLKAIFLKIQIDCENWVNVDQKDREANYVTLRSTSTNLRTQPFFEGLRNTGINDETTQT